MTYRITYHYPESPWMHIETPVDAGNESSARAHVRRVHPGAVVESVERADGREETT